jgi:hypothetical protein
LELSELEIGKAPVEPEFWFVEAGLYHKENYMFEGALKNRGCDKYRANILLVLFPKITIDVYCPNCKRETVFAPFKREEDWHSATNMQTGYSYPIIKYGLHYSHFTCSRNHCGSALYFVFTFNINGDLTKIGQHPSIADLVSPEIKKYSPVLDANLIADWQRAIGLRAHGIGAGSYVYLRRIIENIVREAANTAIQNSEIKEEEFNRLRWPERIKSLSAHLPEYLVKNSKVYGVLSKGVHELSEEECADYFDVMQTSIEIICEEKLAELERTKKASHGYTALQKVLQKIGSKES